MIAQVSGVFFDGVTTVSLINTATNVSVACPTIIINSTYVRCVFLLGYRAAGSH